MATFRIYADSKIHKLNIKKQLSPYKNIKSPFQSNAIRTPFSENKIPRTPFSEKQPGRNELTNTKSKFNLDIFHSPLAKFSSPNIKKSAQLENAKSKKLNIKLFHSPLAKLSSNTLAKLENAKSKKDNTKLLFLDDLKPKITSLINELDLDIFLNEADFVQHTCPKDEISAKLSQLLEINDFKQPDESTFKFPEEPPPPPPIYKDLEYDIPFFSEKPPNFTFTSFEFDDDDDERPDFIF